MKPFFSIWMVFLMAGYFAFGQGTFQNFDFESATIVTAYPPNIILTSDALPEWTVFDGTNQLSIILYNGGSAVSLWGAGYALDGNFSVGFSTGGSISQTGLIPADARTLLFIGTPPSVTSRLLGGFYSRSKSAICTYIPWS